MTPIEVAPWARECPAPTTLERIRQLTKSETARRLILAERLKILGSDEVDPYGMAHVVQTLLLVHICDEKAEHIRSNWQDEGLAKRWDIVVDSLISKRLSKALGGLPG